MRHLSWVPPQLAKSYSPPTHGAELRAQVERKLRAGFDDVKEFLREQGAKLD
jgi:uncharacterized protein YcgL (UPF0745 family)